MPAVLDESVINVLLANWPLSDSSLLGLCHAAALGNVVDTTKRVTQIDLADAKLNPALGLDRIGQLLESSAIRSPHWSPPVQPAGLASLGKLSLASGHIATIRRTLGVNLLGPNAAALLAERLRKVCTDSFNETVQSAGKVYPAGLTRLAHLSSATAAFHGLGINLADGKGATGLASLVSRLRSSGLLLALGRLPFRAVTLTRLSALASFSLAAQSLRSPSQTHPAMISPKRPNIADPLNVSPLRSMWPQIAAGSLGSGLALPSMEELARFNALLSGMQLTRSATGINLLEANGKEKLFRFLESVKSGGACRPIEAEPLTPAQLAGLARLHSAASDLHSIRTGLGVDLLHRDAPSQLARAADDFHKYGGAAMDGADIERDMLSRLSRLSQLGTAADHAAKFGLIKPTG